MAFLLLKCIESDIPGEDVDWKCPACQVSNVETGFENNVQRRVNEKIDYKK